MHEDDGSGHGCDRHHRVHDDAQLAVIGVGGAGVQMRDLGYGQEHQQDEAQTRDDRQKAAPGPGFPAEMCLKSCQILDLDILILQRNVFSWTIDIRTGCLMP